MFYVDRLRPPRIADIRCGCGECLLDRDFCKRCSILGASIDENRHGPWLAAARMTTWNMARSMFPVKFLLENQGAHKRRNDYSHRFGNLFENWDSPRVFHRKYASGATNFGFGNINTFPIQPIWAEGVECEIASSSLSMSSAMVSNIGVDR